MKLYQFNQLDEMEQAEAIWEYGVLIGEMKDEMYRYLLYQIDAFYVEIRYHVENNVINGLRSFSSTDEPLKPYLKQVNIDGIKEN